MWKQFMSHSRHPWHDAAFDARWVTNFQQEEHRINLITKIQLTIHVFITSHTYQSFLYTVAINELLCMKNAGAQIAMDFS